MNVLEIVKKITGRNMVFDYRAGKLMEWVSWYSGKVRKFHRYTINTGKKRVPVERMTLGMPKKVCEDWADLLINEKTDIVLKSDDDQHILNKYLNKNNFWRKANGGIEKMMALGNVAFVEGVKDFGVNNDGDIISNGEPFIQVINGTKIYPLSFENDRVVECAFVNENPGKTILSVHIRGNDGTYEIHTVSCDGLINKQNLAYKEEDHNVFYTKSTTPWFQILKPNIENNIDINSPMGISIYANAIDVLRSIDLTYDSLYNELNLGRKRIFVSTKALTYDPLTGETMSVFDQNDIEYYALPESDDGKPIITDDTQDLRVDAIDKALQRQLNLLSAKCGFGQNRYKFEQGSVATATQIISENSDEFRALKKHEIIIEEALIGMTKALVEIINNYTDDRIASVNEEDIHVQFDDSIIEDKKSEKESDRMDLDKGIISKAEYRSKYYGEDIETAKENVKKIALENDANVFSQIAIIRNDISHETALELNPYIDDVEKELRRIQEESESSFTLFEEPQEEEQEKAVEVDGGQDTQTNG